MLWLIHSQGGLLPHSDPRWWPSLYWQLYGVCEIRPCSNWWRLPSRYNPNFYTIKNEGTFDRNEANVTIHAEISSKRPNSLKHILPRLLQRSNIWRGQYTTIITRRYNGLWAVIWDNANVLFFMWSWPWNFFVWLLEFIFRKSIAVLN